MANLRSLITMKAFPVQSDLALLVLRVLLGGLLLRLHGWGKIDGLSADPVQFADPFGLGPGVSLALSMFAEVVGSALVIIGLATRWAAALVVINLLTAFTLAHGMKLIGQGSGELPLVYLLGFLVLFLAGPGKFSVDAKLND